MVTPTPEGARETAPFLFFGRAYNQRMPSPRTAVPVVLLTLLLASPASAALSPKYVEWRKGGVQWIMTGPETAAWKKVHSDEAAIAFIDLFWARRDPTPGTPENEARDEHEARVKSADERFAERGTRGALTDRGRVWIVLGPPPKADDLMGGIANTVNSQVSAGGGSSGGFAQSEPTAAVTNPTGGRQMGARSVWVWDHAQASERFGMPRVEVVFVTDPITRRTTRDVFRRDFAGAEAAALRQQIRNDYKELPEWAAFGGLEPKTRRVVLSEAAPPPPVAAPKPAVAPPVVAVAPPPRGLTRLTLTRNAFEVDVQGSSDPFAALQAIDRFKTTEELGWVAQYCGQSENAVSVPFRVRLSGGPADDPINALTPLDEVVPDRIPSLPGCSMLRGAIPLDSLAAGEYTLYLMVDDPIVKSESYELKQAFTVE